MINTVILMSGSSQAFKDAGYAYPKNLIEVHGVSLLQRVLEQIRPLDALGSRSICVLRHDENIKHHTGAVIRLICPGAITVELASETAGAACSALLAVEHINNDEPLLIINGDQLLDIDLVAAVREFMDKKLDGGIVVFEDIHPRWSFVKCDAEGHVIETAEKCPISRLATAGFYYFRTGHAFIAAATEMIRKDAQVNGLFYVCPAYNEMILRRSRIGVHLIPRKAYHSLATPADVQAYEAGLADREGAALHDRPYAGR